MKTTSEAALANNGYERIDPSDFDCERVMFPKWSWISSAPPKDLQLNRYRLRESRKSFDLIVNQSRDCEPMLLKKVESEGTSDCVLGWTRLGRCNGTPTCLLF